MQSEPIAIDDLRALDSAAAAARLSPLPDIRVAQLLRALGPGRAVAILDRCLQRAVRGDAPALAKAAVAH